MSMNWQNAEINPPNKENEIVVIDSWNIDENDIDGQEEDQGPDNQNFLSIRVASFDDTRNLWTDPNDQRVRFKWYAVIDLPKELVNQGFRIKHSGIER